MPSINFLDIFCDYVDHGVMDKPSTFALNGFTKNDLEDNDYELIGNPSEFHLYEKEYLSHYYRGSVYLNFKHYFFSKQSVGNGFDIVNAHSGVRLTTLLKRYLRHKNIDQISEAPIEFYFSEDKKNGAVIFNETVVIQFKKKDQRGNYVVLTLESDFDQSGNFSQLSTGSIRRIMNRCEFNVSKRRYRKKYKIKALERLMSFCLS